MAFIQRRWPNVGPTLAKYISVEQQKFQFVDLKPSINRAIAPDIFTLTPYDKCNLKIKKNRKYGIYTATLAQRWPNVGKSYHYLSNKNPYYHSLKVAVFQIQIAVIFMNTIPKESIYVIDTLGKE